MDKKIVHSVFEQIVLENPEAPAINDRDTKSTYKQLNGYANDIAYTLATLSLKVGEHVCTYLQAGTEYVSSIIGINKAGGVFVPLETRHPEKRLNFILNEIKPRIIISSHNHARALRVLLGQHGVFVPEIVVLTSLASGLLEISASEGDHMQTRKTHHAPGNPPLVANGDHANYVLYTSGSTGQPKAIVGCHKSLSHFIHWEIQEFKLDRHAKISHLAPISFDVSLRDIFAPLLAGGELCIPPTGIENPAGFIEWIGQSGVTLMHMVPSVFRLLIQEIKTNRELIPALGSLRHILLAGEPLYTRDVVDWRAIVGEKIQLVNLYGPTETTLAKVFNRIAAIPTSRSAIIPLGQPISNAVVLIIKDHKLCEIGKIGEICIKTPFRSKGYLSDTSLNNDKFVQNPLHNDYEDIIYKTGDLGRYNEERKIEFVGRKDDQIKILGNRVELAEIERVLIDDIRLFNPKLLVIQDDNAAPFIACYILESVQFNENDVRAKLKKFLPDYMHPSYYVLVKEFPLMLNGKVDKKALPKPLTNTATCYEAPINPIEFRLHEIWCHVLALPRVSRTESFFNVGGSSLKAIQIISRIYKEMGVLLKIAEMFSLATIKDIGKFIYNSKKKDFTPIPQALPQENYELSQAQKRISLINMFDGGEKAFNIQNAYVIKGTLDINILHRAFKKLIDRHESLRTVFTHINDDIRQTILPVDKYDFDINVIELRGDNNPHDLARQQATHLAGYKFNLAEGPLFRITVMRVSDVEHVLLITINHIICDGWSLQLLNDEALHLYHSLLNNSQLSLPPLSIQYKDFALWQNDIARRGGLDQHRNYWLSVFGGELPVLDIPSVYSRPAVQAFEGNVAKAVIDKETTQLLKSIAKKEECTLFMVLIASLNVLFYKYASQTDIILGTPVAGREHPDLEGQIGVFVNTLAIRIQFSEHDTFLKLLANVRQRTTEAYEHQAYPFDFLVEDLKLNRDLSRSPLFDAMMVMYESKQPTYQHSTNSDLAFNIFDFEQSVSRYDLTFEVVETSSGLQLNVEYSTRLFNEEYINEIIQSFKTILSEIANNPEQSVSTIPVLDNTQHSQVLLLGQGKHVENRQLSAASMFEAAAKRFPSHIAVAHNDIDLTFEELSRKSDVVANYLTIKNIGPGDIVAIDAVPSTDMIVALLAIVKVNAAFMPVDLQFPNARVDHMLSENKVGFIFTERSPAANTLKAEKLVVNEILLTTDFANLVVRHSYRPEMLQYVLYTSGSTGASKGVAISCGGFVNYISWINNFIFEGRNGFDDALVVSPTFDYAYSCIFATLLRGDTLTIPLVTDLYDMLPGVFREESRISCIEVTPSHVSILRNTGIRKTGIKKLLIGGEELLLEHVHFLRSLNPDIEIFNLYGPTESTIACTGTKIDKQISIGKPLDNTRVYLLDAGLNLTPPGALGEICVAGIGLASHYVNDSSLTKEKFVSLPFDPSIRVYRTGDLGRWLADGNLQYKGRRDHQVKIRGFRIELEEITQALLAINTVTNAAVLTVANTKDEKSIVAFVCGQEVKIEALRTQLLQKLPQYMMPAFFQIIESIPVTANGKTNYKMLREMFTPISLQAPYTPPTTHTEEKLSEIWKDVLGIEKISVHDSFFELGGHSVKAAQIISRIQKEFNTAISLTMLFKKPFIKSLSEEIDVAIWATATESKHVSTHEFVI